MFEIKYFNVQAIFVTRKIRQLLQAFQFFKNIYTYNETIPPTNCIDISASNIPFTNIDGATNHMLRQIDIPQKWFVKLYFNQKMADPTNELYTETNIIDVCQNGNLEKIYHS